MKISADLENTHVKKPCRMAGHNAAHSHVSLFALNSASVTVGGTTYVAVDIGVVAEVL